MKTVVALLFICGLSYVAEATFVGSPYEADPSVVKYVTPLVHQALQKYNANSGDRPQQLLKITHVTAQVVSGMKYTVDMMTVTGPNQPGRPCRMVLLVQPWISKQPQILSYDCVIN